MTRNVPLLSAALLLLSCSHDDGTPAPPAGPTGAEKPASSAVIDPACSFVDVSAKAGVDFVQNCGATGQFNYPETMSGGGGFFDADEDGDLDLFCVNGCSFPPKPGDATHRFFRNKGDGTFEEATKAAGLAVVHRGMGSIAADLDNDGDQDLLVTGVGRTLLFRNRGDGTFEDLSDASGIQTGRWSSAAAFFDYDQDGKLDLALGHYVKWSDAIERANDGERRCIYQRGNRDYCPVADYAPDEVALFHGRGDGTFEEVTKSAGLAGHPCRALGMLVLDVDQDGRLDLLVANDTLPTQLFHNEGPGSDGKVTFLDVGYETGLALDAWGHAYAGMGVAASFEADGGLVVAVGNFSGEPVTFLRQRVAADGRPEGEFEDLSAKNGLREPTLRKVSWGLLFHDFDGDGDEDLFVANGHVGRQQELEGIPYPQPAQLFRRDGERLVELALPADRGLGQPGVGRGLAWGDVDGDGDVDLLLFENQGRARLLENRCTPRGRFLRVKLRGTESPRDGIGALVTVKAGGRVQRRRLVVGTSYFSMGEQVLTFGLGDAARADEVAIEWPSGVRDLLRDLPAGTTLTATEGETGSGRVEHAAAPALVAYAGRSLGELEALARQRPDDVQLWKALGLQALDRSDFAVAERALKRAVELAPDDQIAQLQQLRLLSLRGDREGARRKVGELFDRFGVDLMVLNAWHYLRSAKAEQAAEFVLDEAIRRAPESATFHYRLANLQLEQKRGDAALASFRKAALLDPGYWRAHTAAAVLLLQKNDPAAAESEARAALSTEPGSLEALRLLAQALHAQGRDGDVPALFRARLEQAPDDLAVRLELVAILASMQRKEELAQELTKVLATLERQLAADPHRVDALRTKARTLESMGRRADALAAWRALQSEIANDDEAAQAVKRLGGA